MVWLSLTQPVAPVISKGFNAATAGHSSGTSIARTNFAASVRFAVTVDFGTPRATDSEEDVLQLARNAVVHSPEQALAWAQSQAEPELRQRVLCAVLHAWAENDPRAAVHWVLAQNEDQRLPGLEAVMAGAVRQPELAMQITRELLAENSTTGSACVGLLVNAFSRNGQFQTALEFARSTACETQADSLNVVFSRWAQNQPQDAMQAVAAITDPQLRHAAFQSAVTAWSSCAPATLAAYAVSLPAGEERSQALAKALDNWSLQDPAAMASWLNTLPVGGDFDAGVALMLSKTDGANRTPELAMQWVENMTNPELKQYSLLRLLQEWRQTAPESAQQYIANAAWLDESQRQEILKTFAASP